MEEQENLIPRNMFKTCEIEFKDNPRKIVYAGQLLQGSVRLNLAEDLNVRGVYIHINGKAYARWTHGRDTIYASENYLNQQTYFVGSRESKDKISLDAGTHHYAFEFPLPSDLPSSIRGEIGYIKYTVRVVVNVSFWTSKVFKEPFTLIKALDLNDHRLLRVIDFEFHSSRRN